MRLCDAPHKVARREKIESELSAILHIDPAMQKLLSADGFADYYFEMQDLYPSQMEAYERLENFHIQVTGRRRYSEFDSFRKVLDRRLKKKQKGWPIKISLIKLLKYRSKEVIFKQSFIYL
ncbi:hypothetical protein SAMN05444145_101455 [Alistipes timonensis JC136]|uniref:Uncharacterized protein n=1 Tax=Alistipes timonensis JC136 TaxID=1033731 RepID=A0A1H3Y5W7_9BACT|nr:hypothetical protein SAMN05444145_101455 [Alistipes timonensis JC136]